MLVVLLVCVCVCVCVITFFHLLVSSGCTTSLTYVRWSDQRSFVVSIIRSLCQVSSSPFPNLSYFTSKDENSSPHFTGEKTNDIMLETWKHYDIIPVREKMIYMDIWYKSAHYKNRQWRKDTKDKEATLI